jgi:hypothetical protein
MQMRRVRATGSENEHNKAPIVGQLKHFCVFSRSTTRWQSGRDQQLHIKQESLKKLKMHRDLIFVLNG